LQWHRWSIRWVKTLFAKTGSALWSLLRSRNTGTIVTAKKKILALPEDDIFLKRDIAILDSHFEIRTAPRFNCRRPLRGIQSVFKILRGTFWADVTFSQFADAHAFLAVSFSKVLRKKSIVVVGGYEVARVPEIRYGAMLNPVYAQVVRFILKHADRVLTTAESLQKDAVVNAGVHGHNIKTVPECYDSRFWQRSGEKENAVITVAHIKDSVVRRKGLEVFVEAANYLPEAKFILIGPHVDASVARLKSMAPSNVEFPGFVPEAELPKWYSGAKVYCQLSRYEGLPNALCEAMLCECVPVGTEYCGIPLAIGDTGFYVPYGNVGATVEAIKKALHSDKGKEARKRIAGMFPLHRRQRELITEIEGLLVA